MTDEMMSLDRRIARLGIRMHVSAGKRVSAHDAEDGWEHDRYRVKLTAPLGAVGGGTPMTLVFRMGTGHAGSPPQLADVLDCIASDSAGVENARDFEDWTSYYGYSPDSRKAEAAYKACLKQAKDAKALLGAENYDLLLWHTERL